MNQKQIYHKWNKDILLKCEIGTVLM